jgi:hypothetical protein
MPVFRSALFYVYRLLPLLVITCNSFAQSLTDFSGKWILDNSKSSSLYSGMTSVLILKQSGNVIEIEITLKQGDTESTSHSEKYYIGSTKRENATSLITFWSDDRQSFSVIEVKDDTRNSKVYTLKDGGEALQVKSDETLPGGFVRQTIMLYKKVL